MTQEDEGVTRDEILERLKQIEANLHECSIAQEKLIMERIAIKRYLQELDKGIKISKSQFDSEERATSIIFHLKEWASELRE